MDKKRQLDCDAPTFAAIDIRILFQADIVVFSINVLEHLHTYFLAKMDGLFQHRVNTQAHQDLSMPSDVLIRSAVEADLPAITAIYAQAVYAGVGSYELEPPDVKEMTRRWQNRTRAGYPYIVAVSDEVAVGFSYVGRFRTRPAHRFLVEDSIYVAADARGAGVGRALLTTLIKLCEERGYRQVIALIAGGTENLASVGLHSHLGFRHVGLIEGSAFKQGRWIDTVLMQRALGEGKSSAPAELERS